MAAANTSFTVLLVGRTGMGKSATGNKLLDAWTLENPHGHGDVKRIWPQKEAESPLNFATNPDTGSVTHGCELLVSKLKDGGVVRVLDSEGFAGSDFKGDLNLGNLKVARNIAGVSSELDLKFDRVLYFLPFRGTAQRADKILQDEIGIMWHFFGENLFKNIVLISTIEEGIPPQYAPKEEALQKVFKVAVELAFRDRKISQQPPPCPPVFFISLETDGITLVNGLKKVQVHGGNKAFQPEFSKEVCAKCASSLYKQPDGTLMVVRTGDQFLDSSYGKCHPTFIPKHSKLAKFFGGIAHIIVLGFAGVHQKRTGKRTWPGFF